ncbi:hypothetical protein BV898_05989 [Hypsibius exemplaris]|uniref:Apple domain-containing protein n=1 Tax=Hypsibius exemplaris TaxID=2072580 RepID=A0A1W0WXQ4_HYPEX|nr:hypothetical protein BV898_05989 [Hypsibius exemplaris]
MESLKKRRRQMNKSSAGKVEYDGNWSSPESIVLSVKNDEGRESPEIIAISEEDSCLYHCRAGLCNPPFILAFVLAYLPKNVMDLFNHFPSPFSKWSLFFFVVTFACVGVQGSWHSDICTFMAVNNDVVTTIAASYNECVANCQAESTCSYFFLALNNVCYL